MKIRPVGGRAAKPHRMHHRHCSTHRRWRFTVCRGLFAPAFVCRLSQYSAVLESSASDTSARAGRARALLELGRHDEAAREFETVVAAATDGLEGLVSIYARLGVRGLVAIVSWSSLSTVASTLRA